MTISTNDIIRASNERLNLATKLGKAKLDKLGADAVYGFGIDKQSRTQWEKQNADSMKLALQVTGIKNTPWEGASNIKFPLLTIGAIQFSARAYPSLISGYAPVKCRALGADPDGKKTERAARVSKHMSYQVLEEDEDWEAETDRSLMTVAIVGNTYKKSYFDPAKGRNVAEHVLAQDLIVGYYTKSLETCRRITHILNKHTSDIKTLQRKKIYRDVELPDAPIAEERDEMEQARDESQGVTPPSANEGKDYRILLEQHVWLDLDGDGVEEPYIMVVDKSSQVVLRLTPRIRNIEYASDKKIEQFKALNFFTKYGFIPSPDGGFMDLGLGALLSPLNESVNTIINQLVDSGTLNNLQSGFLGRGIRMKGGVTTFKPGEWKQLLSSGQDLRNGIIPLPTKEPSQVLFALLGTLVNYAERLSSTTDMMVGESPGQNQAATTTMAVVEQGMKVYTGIFKRLFRCMKEEFQKQYLLNREYLNPDFDIQTLIATEGKFTRKVWGLLSLELWQQEFHDKAQVYKKCNEKAKP